MEKSKDDENIKSEEVQAIVDRMPTRWAKYVSLMTGILISLIVISGFIISYPDTVDGQISVTASIAPIRIVANTSGRLILLKENKSKILSGEVIAYIESGANYKDVLIIDSLLKQYTPGIDNISRFPASFILGDLASAFNSFVIANNEFERIKNTDIYNTMRMIINRQIKADKNVISNMNKELAMKKQIIFGSAEQLIVDENLLDISAITEDEYEGKLQSHLSKEESFMNLRSSLLTKQSDINKNNLEIQRITQEEKDMIEKALSDLISTTNSLASMIRLWKEKNLQTATLDGELEYQGFWRNNSFVSSGQELFTIIPEENDIVGEVIIPSIGAGKVEIGQNVNVKINKFPYDEYGFLKGKVESISRISNKIETREGTGEVYQVVISFPDGFKSNYGINLALDFESKGTAEIVIKSKRLVDRLFDNLKAKTNK